MDSFDFRYVAKCSALGCDRPGVYKIAAPWGYGVSRELKNYGLCCEEHREALWLRAVEKARELARTEGEFMGDVTVFRLVSGVRDAQLDPIAGDARPIGE